MDTQRKDVKFVAKTLMLASGGRVFITTGIYVIIRFMFSYYIGRLSGYLEYVGQVFSYYSATGEIYTGPWPQVGFEAIVLCVALFMLGLIIDAGFARYCLAVSRGQKTAFRDVLSGFDYPLKALIAGLMRSVAVMVGLSLFVLPGLYIAYRYRLLYFVLADNQKLSVFQCMKRCSAMSKGRKLYLFNVELSFIGWYYLSYIVSAIIFPIVDVWLKPYVEITMAVFYGGYSGKGYRWSLIPDSETPGKFTIRIINLGDMKPAGGETADGGQSMAGDSRNVHEGTESGGYKAPESEDGPQKPENNGDSPGPESVDGPKEPESENDKKEPEDKDDIKNGGQNADNK